VVQILHKVHGPGNETVLAVCDKQLLGKTLEQGKICFEVSKGFYGGKAITAQELCRKIPEFDNINMVGNKAVGIALEKKLIRPESVMEIAGIKHVQVFKI